MTLSVALVGCGKIADGHVEEIRKMPGRARVVAVCDREALMAEQLAARHGLPSHYDDFATMLRAERPDVVHVTTPPQSHLALARAAMDAGCHVFVEKPLTPTLAEARELLAHAERAGRHVTTGWEYQFDPHALELRDAIASGALGDVVHVESHLGYDLGGAYGRALMADVDHWVHRLPGKLFHNLLDHVLNKILALVPDEDPEVSAFALSRGTRGGRADDLLDELRIVVRGERTTGYATFSSHAKPAAHVMRVYGTRNTAHVDWTSRTIVMEPATTLPSALGRLVPPFLAARSHARRALLNLRHFARAEFHFFAGLRRLLELFYDGIRGGGPPPIAHREMLRVARAIDRVVDQLPRRGEAA